jgi:hypothetical protein
MSRATSKIYYHIAFFWEMLIAIDSQRASTPAESHKKLLNGLEL